jgi:hypothetical protein
MTDSNSRSDTDAHVKDMEERLEEVEADIAEARRDEEQLHPEQSQPMFADSGTNDPSKDDQTIAPG